MESSTSGLNVLRSLLEWAAHQDHRHIQQSWFLFTTATAAGAMCFESRPLSVAPFFETENCEPVFRGLRVHRQETTCALQINEFQTFSPCPGLCSHRTSSPNPHGSVSYAIAWRELGIPALRRKPLVRLGAARHRAHLGRSRAGRGNRPTVDSDRSRDGPVL